jgi:hypothetical protein
MKKILVILTCITILLSLTIVSASRLPTVEGDEDDWGTILNDFLSKIAGGDGIKLNQTMVNGTNIYSSSINTTHLLDGTIISEDLGTNSVGDDEINYTEVTLTKFTNDANYLDKDTGGTIEGDVIINGNLTWIASYLNSTVTNQYLNGSFFPNLTNLFDLGSSSLIWKNLYINKILAIDWTNVTITKSQITDADWWDENSDLTEDEISEENINFTTSCGVGNHLYINGNDLGCEVDGGNLSWNQSLADSLYADISLTSNSSWNQSLANSLYADISVTGNSSWNQSLANSLYADISVTGNSSWNQSFADNLYADISVTGNSSWNQSLADSLYTNISVTGNSSWNQSLTDTLYSPIGTENCNSSGSCSGGDIAYMDYNNSGSLGIGRATEAGYKLSIKGDTYAQMRLDATGSNDAAIVFSQSGTQVAKLGYDESDGVFKIISGTGSFASSSFTMNSNSEFAFGTTPQTGVALKIKDTIAQIILDSDIENDIAYILSQNGTQKSKWGYDDSENAIVFVADSGTFSSADMKLTPTNLSLPNDNQKLLFGEGNNASIYFDGSNLIIDPQEAGTNFANVKGILQVDSRDYSDTPFEVNNKDGHQIFSASNDADGDGLFYLRNKTGNSKIRLYANGDSYITGSNLGIGTITPSVKLNIVGTGGDIFKVENTNSYFSVGDIDMNWESTGTSSKSDIIFKDQDNNDTRAVLQLQGNAGDNEIAYFASSGKVGIGTITPSVKLDVNGSGNFTGNITSNYFMGDGSLLTGIDSTSCNSSGSCSGGNITYMNYNNGGNFTVDEGVQADIIGIGAAPYSGAGLFMQRTYTDNSGGLRGISGGVFTNPTAQSSVTLEGAVFTARSTTGNSQRMTGYLIGSSMTAVHRGTGILDDAIGLQASAQTTNGGNITYAKGVHILQGNTNGTITNNYGLYIDDIVNGTNNYAIYSLGGDVALHSDNQKLLFGEGDDASITYNGSDMLFNSQEVGTGNFIFENGKVGIGTTTPDTAVHINSSNPSIKISDSDVENVSGYLSADSNVISLSQNRQYGGFNTADPEKASAEINLYTNDEDSLILFRTTATNNVAPTERMRIDADGKVSIGRTDTPYLLSLNATGAQYSQQTVELRNDAEDGKANYRMKNDVQVWDFFLNGADADKFMISDVTNDEFPFKIEPGAPTNTFYINGSGSVGIGTATPTHELNVVGDVNVTGNVIASGVSQQITSQSWDAIVGETGTSTTWANLPTDMAVTLTTDDSTIYVDAYISRVQHSSISTPTRYRITVDGTQIAQTMVGEHSDWYFRAIAFHGVASVSNGSHTVRVQYKTAAGTENWANDSNGEQHRELTVMEFKD